MSLLSFLAAAGVGAASVVIYQRTKAKSGDAKPTAQEYVAEAKNLVDEVADKAKEAAPVVTEKVKEAAPVVVDKAKEVVNKAKDDLNIK